MFRDLIAELVRGWDSYRDKRLVDSEDRVYEIVSVDLPTVMRTWSPNSGRYKFDGSTGMGNISGAPYVATFNLEITDGAKHGYYLVYLLSADLKRLVLLIGFGVYQFQDYYGASKKMFEALETAATNMRVNTAHLANDELVRTRSRTNAVPAQLDDGNFRLLRGYEKCSIYSLTYEVGNLPSDDELAADYQEYLRLYDRMADSLLLADVDAYVYELADEPQPPGEGAPAATEAPFIPRQFPRRRQQSPGMAQDSPGRRYSKKADKAGKLGEQHVVDFERRRLTQAGRPDLAKRIVWHRNDPTNRTPGWDVTSFDESGDERLIEVKASDGKEIKDVELTVNEWKQAQLHLESGKYCIYLVSEVFKRPVIQIVRNPAKLELAGTLTVDVAQYTLLLGARNQK
jgi:hypothetical protein